MSKSFAWRFNICSCTHFPIHFTMCPYFETKNFIFTFSITKKFWLVVKVKILLFSINKLKSEFFDIVSLIIKFKYSSVITFFKKNHTKLTKFRALKTYCLSKVVRNKDQNQWGKKYSITKIEYSITKKVPVEKS